MNSTLQLKAKSQRIFLSMKLEIITGPAFSASPLYEVVILPTFRKHLLLPSSGTK